MEWVAQKFLHLRMQGEADKKICHIDTDKYVEETVVNWLGNMCLTMSSWKETKTINGIKNTTNSKGK